MSVFLAKKFIARFTLEMFLYTSGLALVQSDDIVLLSHLVTVDCTESRSKTTERRDAEDCTVLNAIIWFSSEC